MQLFCVGSWLCSLLYLYQQFVFSSIASWWLEDPSGGGEGNEVALCARKMAIQARSGPRGQNQPAGYDWCQAPRSTGMKLSTAIVGSVGCLGQEGFLLWEGVEFLVCLAWVLALPIHLAHFCFQQDVCLLITWRPGTAIKPKCFSSDFPENRLTGTWAGQSQGKQVKHVMVFHVHKRHQSEWGAAGSRRCWGIPKHTVHILSIFKIRKQEGIPMASCFLIYLSYMLLAQGADFSQQSLSEACRCCLGRMMALGSDEELQKAKGCAHCTSLRQHHGSQRSQMCRGVVLLPGHLFSFFGVCGLRQKFMAEVDLLYNPCSELRLRSVCLLSPRTNTCSKLPERPG